MRYAIVSDIHSNIVALDSVLSDLEDRKYDKLICLGDIIGYGPRPKKCLDKIRQESDIIIQGNHDRMVAKDQSYLRLPKRVKKGLEHSERRLDNSDIDWLKSLDQKYEVSDNYLIAHSYPKILDKYVYPKEFGNMVPIMRENSVDFLSLGHTHVQDSISKTVNGEIYHILNPGSVGQPRDGNINSAYAILDTENQESEFYRCSYNIRKVISQVKNEEVLPDKNGIRLKSGN